MIVTETTNAGLKREFTVVLPAQDIAAKVDGKLAELGQSARIPGFRPGKVPIQVLRQRYGQAVMGEVLQDAIQTSSRQTIEDRGLRPALEPQVEIKGFAEGGDLEFTMALEVLPDIQLQEFGQLSFERMRARIDEAEIDAALTRLAEQNGKVEPIAEDRPAASGDILVVDFEGTIDGAPFAGGSATDFHLELGRGIFLPAFEEQIPGHKAGEAFTIEVPFPADYGNAELAGKTASFAVTIKEIRQRLPATVDDALAQTMGLANVAALRDAIRTEMERDFGRVGRARVKRTLLDRLAESYDFPIPAGMVDVEFEQIWGRVEGERKAAQEAGRPIDDGGKSDDELKAEYRAIAERRVRLGLLLSEIGRINNLTVSPEEVNRAVAEEARRHPGQEREVMEFYRKNPGALYAVRAPLFEDKVVDFILEMATVTDREVSVEELLKDVDEATA